MGGGTRDARFGPSRRLRKAREYHHVFEHTDARASHRHLLLLARSNDFDHHRLGLVIAKKHIRRAVDRNRVKRLAREFFRLQETGAPHMDVVLIARRGLGELDNEAIFTILRRQWDKLSCTFREASSHSNSSRNR